MGPFWILAILRHLLVRGTKRRPNFGNRPCVMLETNQLVVQGFSEQCGKASTPVLFQKNPNLLST